MELNLYERFGERKKKHEDLLSSVKSLINLQNRSFYVGHFTFRLQYEDDYEYEFAVLSTRFRFDGRKFSKCACSEL